MTETAFEAALAARTAEMLDACTRCGKCVEICPMADAGRRRRCRAESGDFRRARYLARRRGRRRRRPGPKVARSPATASRPVTRASIRASCWRWRVLPWRGNLPSCASGANKASKISAWLPTASMCSARMQLDETELARLGQYVNERLQNGSTAKPGERPDFVFLHRLQCAQDPAHGAHSRSTSWMRSASPTKSWAGRPIAAA